MSVAAAKDEMDMPPWTLAEQESLPRQIN